MSKLIKANLKDLKTIKDYQRYFVTEEDAKKHFQEIKNNTPSGQDSKIYPEDQEWWVQTGETYFYMYEEPPLGVTDIIYGLCECCEFRKYGYDDVVTLASFYKLDRKGNKDGRMLESKEFDCQLNSVCKNIENDGGISVDKYIFSSGKGSPYETWEEMKEYATNEVELKNKRTGIDKIK